VSLPATCLERSTLKRFGVADSDAQNSTIGRLDHRGNKIATPADRYHHLACTEPHDFLKAAHDIDMRQGPPAIFTALDCYDMARIEACQQTRGRHRIAAGTKRDMRPAVIESERDGHFGTVASRKIELALDIGSVRADRLPPAIDNDLWGVK